MTTTNQILAPPYPTVEQLLLEGGDERIALDTRGLNKYGCAPLPDPELIALGSSTATGISVPGLLAAKHLRDRLACSKGASRPRELGRIKQELALLCGISALPGLEIILAASGTDAHTIAARILFAAAARPMLAIMVGEAESGSGVPTALAESIAPAGTINVVSVPIRLPDGMPRPPAEVDAEFAAMTGRAAASGLRVLLVLADISKTGLIAPSPACVIALHDRYPDMVDVLVDACQFRVTPETLRAYLGRGYIVAMTGSKFVTGPTFSGALFIPPPHTRHLRKKELATERPPNRNYPDELDGKNIAGIDIPVSDGLLLRWEAALEDLRVFRLVPEIEVVSFLQQFADAIRERLLNDPAFEMLPVPVLDRHPLIQDPGWDAIQTIFSFRLQHPESHQPLNREQTAQVYQLLRADLSHQPEFDLGELAALRCQLGQPVACGVCQDIPVSALRLCASARMVVEATSQGGKNTPLVIRQALNTLSKAARLAATIGN